MNINTNNTSHCSTLRPIEQMYIDHFRDLLNDFKIFSEKPDSIVSRN